MIQQLEETHSCLPCSLPEGNPALLQVQTELGLAEDEVKRGQFVSTEYHEVEKMTNGLAIKW